MTFFCGCRLAGAPQKCAFVKDTMNIVDLLAIAPYFITLAVLESTPEGEDSGFSELKKYVSVFRIMRILRVFKLARHSPGLQVKLLLLLLLLLLLPLQAIAYTITTSYTELGLLVLFMCMGVLVFSSLCFFAEKDEEDTPFVSIPQTFW